MRVAGIPFWDREAPDFRAVRWGFRSTAGGRYFRTGSLHMSSIRDAFTLIRKCRLHEPASVRSLVLSKWKVPE